MFASPRISVIGLGYVGLPLAIHLARHFDVTGFDIDATRIAELKSGEDRTAEVDGAALRDTKMDFTDDEVALAKSCFPNKKLKTKQNTKQKVIRTKCPKIL